MKIVPPKDRLFLTLMPSVTGRLLGPLDGIPYAAKDNFCTLGVPTTAASAILAGFVPPYDSTPTRRLKRAGAPLLGKTNMDEFGMGSGTLFSVHGHTLNPWSIGAGERDAAGSEGMVSGPRVRECPRDALIRILFIA